jgi:succinate dehydrogenase / fumarate reductase cytochrome b subunit
MENKNNPLSPHLQIYSWHISSLLSITHRVVGVINFIAVIFVSLWTILLLFGESNYESIQIFFQSFFGKFFIIALCWTFSFHILNEIRHLAWDMGYGFDLKVSRITGVITIFGSFVLAISIYLFGRNVI